MVANSTTDRNLSRDYSWFGEHTFFSRRILTDICKKNSAMESKITRDDV